MANEIVQNQQKAISPAQRAMLFAQLTRQHIQRVAPRVCANGGSVSFDIPKSRLLSKIYLLLEATVNLTDAGVDPCVCTPFAPFTWINQIEVNLNNGFAPFVISGNDAYMYNLLRQAATQVIPLQDTAAVVLASRRPNKVGLTTAALGADNQVKMLIELPLTLNDRDPQGLVMLQNSDILVNVNVTLGDFQTNCIVTPTTTATCAAGCTITPIIETFSIPALPEALPDLSILKLVQSRQIAIAAPGQQIISLPVGNMYRRMVVFVSDATGGESPNDLGAIDFELILNTADTPYQIPQFGLGAINALDYVTPLPNGMYVFDFTRSGPCANYGGSRDYLDTERLTEFWLRFTAAAPGNVRIITETLARLKMSK